MRSAPGPQGLYDPAYEHDACGVAFVVDMHGRPATTSSTRASLSLCHLDHRGASGAEANTGDGAGILIQVPDRFLREVVDVDLPPAGPTPPASPSCPGPEQADAAVAAIDKIAASEGLEVLGWRDVPVDTSAWASMARDVRAVLPPGVPGRRRRRAVRARPGAAGLPGPQARSSTRSGPRAPTASPAPGRAVYFPSLSCRTLVYKGMLTTPQLGEFFPDLQDPRLESAIALVHSRFSTNTFPSWPLAHPYRYIAHNGEINTVKGNRNWMRAREALLASDAFGGDADPTSTAPSPSAPTSASDTASFDEALELLHLAGRPAAPRRADDDPRGVGEPTRTWTPAKRAFYQFHASLMEPWDGPASVAFTDGTVVGAVLDRNGLRPSRYWVTADGLVVMASEVGVLDIDPADVVTRGPPPARADVPGRHRPGPDHRRRGDQGRAWPPSTPTASGSTPACCRSTSCPTGPTSATRTRDVVRRQLTFGYTIEDLKILMAPMAQTGGEALGSMGTDTPMAVLSERPRLLFDYFTQLFAQVTNPPLDAIREELVTSLLAACSAPRGTCWTRRRPRAARSSSATRSSTTTSWPSWSTSTTRATCPAWPGRGARPLPGGRGRGGPARRPRGGPGRGRRRHRRRGHGSSSCPTAASTAEHGAHPVPAAHQRGAPPPGAREDPHPGRPGRRGRRRPRGAPHVPADRLRRLRPSTPTWPSRPSRT